MDYFCDFVANYSLPVTPPPFFEVKMTMLSYIDEFTTLLSWTAFEELIVLAPEGKVENLASAFVVARNACQFDLPEPRLIGVVAREVKQLPLFSSASIAFIVEEVVRTEHADWSTLTRSEAKSRTKAFVAECRRIGITKTNFPDRTPDKIDKLLISDEAMIGEIKGAETTKSVVDIVLSAMREKDLPVRELQPPTILRRSIRDLESSSCESAKPRSVTFSDRAVVHPHFEKKEVPKWVGVSTNEVLFMNLTIDTCGKSSIEHPMASGEFRNMFGPCKRWCDID